MSVYTRIEATILGIEKGKNGKTSKALQSKVLSFAHSACVSVKKLFSNNIDDMHDEMPKSLTISE